MVFFKPEKIAIITLLSSSNNTLVTASNIKNYIIFSYSCGRLGLDGAKRSTAYAGQNVGYFLGKKLFFLGYKYAYIKLKGFGLGRFSCIKGLYYSGIKIICIFDATSFAFNGCKKPKKRRI
jgi:small subunit ribosomal protein S11